MGRRNNNSKRPYQQQANNFDAIQKMIEERKKFHINLNDFKTPKGNRHKNAKGYNLVSFNKCKDYIRVAISFNEKTVKNFKSERILFAIQKNSDGEARLYFVESENGYKLTRNGTDKKYKVAMQLEGQEIKDFEKFLGTYESLLYDPENGLYYFEPIKKN